MVRSYSDDNKGTEPPRLSPKVWTVGSIPVTDEGFFKWCGYQTKRGTPLAMMTLYVQQLNLEAKMLHEQQRKERRELSHPSETAGAVLLSEPNEPSTASANQVMEPAIDLSVSSTGPDKDSKKTSAAPVNRLSFKQALEISKNNRSQGAAIGTSTGTDSVPSHRRLITLSSLGTKKDDSANKRTRTSAEPSNVFHSCLLSLSLSLSSTLVSYLCLCDCLCVFVFVPDFAFVFCLLSFIFYLLSFVFCLWEI
jgi:hypothetical protein